ncbi:hypothetical protein LEP1GSC133_1343 [Leptospira borgpetersenii serovar Pomona str. 200901868]|uniref:Uncharacterized protein n=1 Tax=Leptospira borgpetersenii serovar Pomona str. 200901868 TaxID=1192866 RepID=M6WH85_LEPBO|nr:hypothetical protein LEP1GSC133_1343 [Leptospira borgpetersenii serovar Pomona str. 200901868]
MLIYGFFNEFYRWNILVGVPTPDVLGQVFNLKVYLKRSLEIH